MEAEAQESGVGQVAILKVVLEFTMIKRKREPQLKGQKLNHADSGSEDVTTSQMQNW